MAILLKSILFAGVCFARAFFDLRKASAKEIKWECSFVIAAIAYTLLIPVPSSLGEFVGRLKDAGMNGVYGLIIVIALAYLWRLITAPARIYFEQRVEIEKHKTKPVQPLANADSMSVVIYLGMQGAFLNDHGNHQLAASLTRAAHNGLSVWGCERPLKDEERIVHYIPKEKFSKWAIAPQSYSSFQLRIIDVERGAIFGSVYDDVMFSREEIVELWPSDVPWPTKPSTSET